ncbi:hypothetical protein PBY51_002424 [Eleginops maclovinus]|uniref:Uncharacterized protein n=1 Tax=Eleginops maclovinus TaxID=56733 RepID=A0AAN7X5Z1_ELEMC|nr:hypothetical protein PBY51_002424 [Eleginops maclovinus]
MSLVSAGVRNCQGVVFFPLQHVMPPQENPECLGASDRANVPTAAVSIINQENIESISSDCSQLHFIPEQLHQRHTLRLTDCWATV